MRRMAKLALLALFLPALAFAQEAGENGAEADTGIQAGTQEADTGLQAGTEETDTGISAKGAGIQNETAGIPAADTGEASPEKSFKVTITSMADAVFLLVPLGDYAEKTPKYQDSPYPYQGNGWKRFFQSAAFDDPVNALLKLQYTGDFAGGFITLKADTDSGYTGIWDWDVWTTLFGDHLRLAGGNQAKYSKVLNYQNFDDMLKTKVDGLGVLYPNWEIVPLNSSGAGNVVPAFNFPYGYDTPGADKGYATFAGTYTDDLFMPAGGFSRRQDGWLMGLTFAPITVSAAVGGLFEELSLPFANPWYENTGGVLPTHDSTTDPVVTTDMNAAGRIEASSLGGFVNLAAVYKYARTTLTKLELQSGQSETNAKIDEEVGNHAFGLYANADLGRFVNGLGLTLGYSGLQQTWTNGTHWTPDSSDKSQQANHGYSSKSEALFPLYSGIDLRVQYTGVPRLRLTFNNNVSFARMWGTTDYDKQWVVGWAYDGSISGELNEDARGVYDRREDYLGLYNALGLKFTLTDTVALDFQAANRLGLFTLNWEKDAVSSSTDQLGGYLGCSYSRKGKGSLVATVRAGVAAVLVSASYQAPGSENIHKAGWLEFGVPLELKVEF